MMSGSCRNTLRSPAANVRPFLVLICVWLMPSIWYSIGSSSVTTFRVAGVDFLKGGVERRALAAAGRAGDQNEAVLQANHVAELDQDFAVHADFGQRVEPGTFVEEPQDNPLAMAARQRGNAKVDPPIAHLNGGPAILRQPLFGDVHLADDFDAAHDFFLKWLRHVKRIEQHAIDPKSDDEPALRRAGYGHPTPRPSPLRTA